MSDDDDILNNQYRDEEVLMLFSSGIPYVCLMMMANTK